jgi:hypothetical protein
MSGRAQCSAGLCKAASVIQRDRRVETQSARSDPTGDDQIAAVVESLIAYVESLSASCAERFSRAEERT